MTPDQVVYKTAVSDGIPDPLAAFLVDQSRHETGNYSSHAFVDYNNAFGYSYVPGGKWQAGPGSIADNGQPLATYNSVEDSTHEITDWIKRRVNEGRFPDLETIQTRDQYATLLKNAGYYGDSVQNYTAGLYRWASDNYGAISLSGVAVLIALVAAWIILKK